ncbi:MAG: DUF1566 domain-containing protein [Bacteroidales bacterium]|nr:DUF1566 domain-containing protein [Bacteroidales bacterium]
MKKLIIISVALIVSVAINAQESPKEFQFNYQSYEILPGDLEGFYTWSDAMSTCKNLSAFGKNDWYLPDMHELDAIYKRKNEIGGFEKEFVYWSSEQDAEGIWAQNFSDGRHLQGSHDGYAMVRCIRKK